MYIEAKASVRQSDLLTDLMTLCPDGWAALLSKARPFLVLLKRFQGAFKAQSGSYPPPGRECKRNVSVMGSFGGTV